MEEINLTEENKNMSKIGWSFFAVLVLYNGITIAGAYLTSRFCPELYKWEWFQWILMIISQYLIAMPVGIAMLLGLPVCKPQKDSFTAKELMILFFAAAALMHIGNLIGQGVNYAVSLLKGGLVLNPLEDMVMDAPTAAVFAAAVILAPIMEELLFRKLLIDRTLQWGDQRAMFISALLFGLFHGNLYQFFYAFLLGLVFAYMYIRSGKIRYSIAFHMIINFCGSVLGLQLLNQSILIIALYAVIVVSVVIVGIVFIAVFRKRAVYGETLINCTKREWRRTVFGNMGMFFLIFGCVILFAVSAIL